MQQPLGRLRRNAQLRAEGASERRVTGIDSSPGPTLSDAPGVDTAAGERLEIDQVEIKIEDQMQVRDIVVRVGSTPQVHELDERHGRGTVAGAVGERDGTPGGART